MNLTSSVEHREAGSIVNIIALQTSKSDPGDMRRKKIKFKLMLRESSPGCLALMSRTKSPQQPSRDSLPTAKQSTSQHQDTRQKGQESVELQSATCVRQAVFNGVIASRRCAVRSPFHSSESRRKPNIRGTRIVFKKQVDDHHLSTRKRRKEEDCLELTGLDV